MLLWWQQPEHQSRIVMSSSYFLFIFSSCFRAGTLLSLAEQVEGNCDWCGDKSVTALSPCESHQPWDGVPAHQPGCMDPYLMRCEWQGERQAHPSSYRYVPVGLQSRGLLCVQPNGYEDLQACISSCWASMQLLPTIQLIDIHPVWMEFIHNNQKGRQMKDNIC